MIEIEIRVRTMVRELEAEIEAAGGVNQPPGKLDGTEGRLSRQDSLMHHEMAKEGQRRRQQRVQALRTALQRMDEGAYGVCANCGREIPFDRLDAQPETLTCGCGS